MKSEINLWVRANQHTYDPDTFELVRDVDKPDYVRIMSDIAIRGAELNEAQARYQEALAERHSFFTDQMAAPDNVIQFRPREEPEDLVA